MATIVRIDSRSKAAKLFIEYIKTLSFVKVESEQPRYNSQTEKAIEEARAKKGITKTSDHADLMTKLLS